MRLKSHKACSNCRKQKACPLFPFVMFVIDAEINMILQSKCVKKETDERCRMCKAKGLECVFEQRTARKQPM